MAATSDGARAFRPGLVIGVCILIATLEGYDVQAFGVAAPHMAPELGLNPSQVGWAGSAANFGLVLGALAGGWAADRWGRKPVLLASVLAFGLFSLATAFSQGFEPLLLARFLTGLGFGGVMPNLIALAAEIARPGRRAALTSAMFCGMPAGGAGVSLLARLAGEHADWRLLFLVGGGLPMLIAPLVVWVLPETRPQPEPHLDRNLAKALFAEGRLAPTLLLWAASLLTLVVLHLLLNWLPILVAAKGHTAGDGATAALVFNVMGVVGAVALGVAADRAGVRRTMLVAFLALGAAMAAIGAATGLGPILAAAAAAGFMLIGALYVLYGLAPALYPAQVRSAAAGAAVGVGRFGSILGPLVAGQLRQAGWSAGHVLTAMVPVALVAGVAVMAMTYLAKLDNS
ncbi:MFS transporter [Phenylobacterium sp.]|uniref:MFS transporter n=1 Tax=Phenylobacterium sp. TaxID=1871053 RepID=UPI00356640D3